MTAKIRTVSGVYLDLLDPKVEDIKITDIAHALANICRFGGHPREFYSVAQHSVRVSYLVDEEYALEALLHDATEAYLGDVITPLKNILPEYRRLEEKLDGIIRKAFDLPAVPTPCVKTADVIMYEAEAHELSTPRIETLFITRGGVVPIATQPINTGQVRYELPSEPRQARARFISRFTFLTGKLI